MKFKSKKYNSKFGTLFFQKLNLKYFNSAKKDTLYDEYLYDKNKNPYKMRETNPCSVITRDETLFMTYRVQQSPLVQYY